MGRQSNKCRNASSPSPPPIALSAETAGTESTNATAAAAATLLAAAAATALTKDDSDAVDNAAVAIACADAATTTAPGIAGSSSHGFDCRLCPLGPHILIPCGSVSRRRCGLDRLASNFDFCWMCMRRNKDAIDNEDKKNQGAKKINDRQGRSRSPKSQNDHGNNQQEQEAAGFCCLPCKFYVCSDDCAQQAQSKATQWGVLFSMVHRTTGSVTRDSFQKAQKSYCNHILGLQRERFLPAREEEDTPASPRSRKKDQLTGLLLRDLVVALASTRLTCILTDKLLQQRRQHLNISDLEAMTEANATAWKVYDKAQKRANGFQHPEFSPSARERQKGYDQQRRIHNLIVNYSAGIDGESCEFNENAPTQKKSVLAGCLFNFTEFDRAAACYTPMTQAKWWNDITQNEKARALVKANKAYAVGVKAILTTGRNSSYDDAILHHRECLRYLRIAGGPKGVVKTIIWTQVALLYLLNSASLSAQADLQGVLEIQRSLLGQHHPYTKSTKDMLDCADSIEDHLANMAVAWHIPPWVSHSTRKYLWLLDEYRKCLEKSGYWHSSVSGTPTALMGGGQAQIQVAEAHKILQDLHTTLSEFKDIGKKCLAPFIREQQKMAIDGCVKKHSSVLNLVELLKTNLLLARIAGEAESENVELSLPKMKELLYSLVIRENTYGTGGVGGELVHQGRALIEKTAERVKELSMMAVSVFHLKTTFAEGLYAAGYSPSSTVYDIENLSGPPGFIRQKGHDTICPLTGKRGSSYVHALSSLDADQIGPANYMLSYSWRYTIGDIIDTLDSFCKANHKDTKRTYVWICCLCVNQWRVVEQTQIEKSGMLRSSVDFFTVFGDRVASIGHILAMMTPWQQPTYLERIWCIFELYTAHIKGCEVSVVMPPSQRAALEEALFGDDAKNIDAFYDVLSKTRVQDAKASVEHDRTAILEMVQKQAGYSEINHRVNELMREWVGSAISETVEKWKKVGKGRRRDVIYSVLGQGDKQRNERLLYSSFCSEMGLLLERNGDHASALDMQKKALAARELVLGKTASLTAESHQNIGSVLQSMGKYDLASSEFEKSLLIFETSLGKNHPRTATAYTSFGSLLVIQDDFYLALKFYRKALAIDKSTKKVSDSETASTYDHIGDVLFRQARYNEALEEYQRSLHIRRSMSDGNSAVESAKSLRKIAGVLQTLGDFDEALINLHKALQSCQSVLGTNRLENASIHSDVAGVLLQKGLFAEARVDFEKCHDIIESILGDDHPYSAASYRNIGLALQEMGHLDRAMLALRKAADIREKVLGKDHRDTAESYIDIGVLFQKTGEYNKALVELLKAEELGLVDAILRSSLIHRCIGSVLCAQGKYVAAEERIMKCIEIQQRVLGSVHPALAVSFHSLGEALSGNSRDGFDRALMEHKKALMIREHTFGKKHMLVAESCIFVARHILKFRKKPSLQLLDESKDLLQRALEIRQSIFGRDHQYMADIYVLLAPVYKEKGDPTRAEALLNLARRIRIHKLRSSLALIHNQTFPMAPLSRKLGKTTHRVEQGSEKLHHSSSAIVCSREGRRKGNANSFGTRHRKPTARVIHELRQHQHRSLDHIDVQKQRHPQPEKAPQKANTETPKPACRKAEHVHPFATRKTHST